MLKDLLGRLRRHGDQSSIHATDNPAEVAGPGESRRPRHIATEVVVPDALTVDVFRHELLSQQGPVACWTLVSQGLQSLGQREVCFSVKIEPGEADTDYPRSLLPMYSTLHHFAAQSRFVNAGEVTGLAEGHGLLGRADFTGIVYSIPQVFDGIRLPADALTALIVTGGEFQAVREYGSVRLAALLGDQCRYFPTTPWADRQRRPLTSPAEMEKSLLTKVPRFAVAGAVSYLLRDGENSATPVVRPGDPDRPVTTAGEVVLEVTGAAMPVLLAGLNSLGEDTPVAVISGPDRVADSCLVWRPGTKQVHAIAGPGSSGRRLAGNHVVFLPAQERNSVAIVEDGFLLQLTTKHWSAFRDALNGDATSWSAPDTGKMTFRFQQVRTAHGDPLHRVLAGSADASSPVADDGRGRHTPIDGSDPQAAGPARTRHVRLLTEQDRIPERTTIAALSTFIQTINRVANQHLAPTDKSFRLLIQVTCMPTRHDVKLATQGDAPQDLLRTLLEALEGMERLPVSEADVSFQMELVVSPIGATETAGRPLGS